MDGQPLLIQLVTILAQRLAIDGDGQQAEVLAVQPQRAGGMALYVQPGVDDGGFRLELETERHIADGEGGGLVIGQANGLAGGDGGHAYSPWVWQNAAGLA